MIVVDTSAWIEWLLDTPVAASLRPYLPGPDEWVVPTIVQLELAKWMGREGADEVADRVIALTQMSKVVPLITETALEAAELSRSHRLPTADAIIYATALALQCRLLTCDAHFADLDGVVLIPKRSAH